jgi:hypothetical protein
VRLQNVTRICLRHVTLFILPLSLIIYYIRSKILYIGNTPKKRRDNEIRWKVVMHKYRII